MRRSSHLSIVLAVLSFGCAPTNPGLTIEGVIVPNDTCLISASSAFLGEATLDTNPDAPRSGGIRYVANLRVANRLINTGNRVYPVQADTSVISMESAEVEVLQTDGARVAFAGLPNPFRVTAVGTIPSTTSNEPQFGTTVAEVLPAQYGDALAGTATGSILLSIRVVGITSGGSQVVSGRTLLPIRLCDGCLFQCVVDATTMAELEQPSCQPGQDQVTYTCR